MVEISLWSLPASLWIQDVESTPAVLTESLVELGATRHERLPGLFLPLTREACGFVNFLLTSNLGKAHGVELTRAARVAVEMVLAGLPVNPRSHKALALRENIARMRSHPSVLRAGHMHSWWEYIFDAEAVLEGRESLAGWTLETALAETNRVLHIDSSGPHDAGPITPAGESTDVT